MERREGSSRFIILIFFIPFLIWILLQFLAPFALPHGSTHDLSGYVGVADNEKLIDELPSPWNAIYGGGDRLCHQKEERSFIFNGNQMPFCSRCTAIWLGLAIGLGIMVFYTIQLDYKFLLLIIIGLVPLGIDGVGQLFKFWESTNIIRVITGVLVGIICGLAIGIIVDEIREIFISKKQKVVNKEK
jgi:uncharacterized membrane protein